MTDDFRCSAASANDLEPIAGTAPTGTEFLLVEHPGPWGRQAVQESRLPQSVRDHLAALEGVTVHLIRCHGRGASTRSGGGTRVFRAVATPEGFAVTTALLAGPEELLTLERAEMSPYEGLLWLVCTNGARDRCCAEIGRPVTAALAARWPEGTWETTHLGGHRFSGTLMALPSGHTLARLSPQNAVDACEEVAAGGVPLELSRGRAGRTGVEQFRELHVLAGGNPAAEIVAEPGPARRQSCGDDKQKPTVRYRAETKAP
jgi:hypothetical protein